MRTARSVFAAAAIVLALAAVASARQAAGNRAEVALQAAVKMETIDGDLKAAIEAYHKVAATYATDRAVAARTRSASMPSGTWRWTSAAANSGAGARRWP